MLEILNETQADLVATKASNKVNADDMDKLLPVLNSAIEKYGKVSWYYEMDGLEGWTLKGFWKDISFDVLHANSFKKIAMVGEKHWEKIMTELMKPFTSAEVRYFDKQKREEAMRWIKSNY